MHTTSELDSNVPAFLAKLWKMVDDPKIDNLISWSPSGKSFFIRNQAKFATNLLPHYYKHSNMASFIRQLNMYGFHKKVSVELGGLKCDKDEIEFAHQYFVKDQPHSIKHIKRKVATNKSQDPARPISAELVTKIFAEVRDMKGRHDHMDSTLNEIKQENSALWREIVMLRQKHLKQQQIINKLIQFLVTLVQPSRSGISVKRRYPLMIDSSRSHKQSKLSKAQKSPTGPVIHELDASEPDIDSDYLASEIIANEMPTVQSPQEHIETQIDDENTEIIYSVNEFVQNPKIEEETKKKRVCKDKKKEELHVLEVSTDEDEPVTLSNKNTIHSKPIPMATVRSSKLAAMAANIKSQDIDTDIDTPGDLEDNMEALDNDASMVKLEDILIVPEMLNSSNIKNMMENEVNNSNLNKMNTNLNQMDDGKNILMTNNNEEYNECRKIKSSNEGNNRYDSAGASSSNDLLVSRVNSSGKANANYREIDSRLDSMQTDLDKINNSLCEAFYGENCSIDANTLLQLFGDDNSLGYELSINPEFNSIQEDDETIIPDSINGSVGGELMAYNPSSNLPDFDIFMQNESDSNPSDLQINNLYTTDSLENSKDSLFDAVNDDVNSKSHHLNLNRFIIMIM
ncbi:heat shock factor protein isoform X2 [Solenopsis invicta]|uniref:heat shock factor protein isoform X2 n=1 Tax=Solenopsis invicta TaxID=13686 RepID=UPI000595B875|nr:heat shock factor protein isoform X2 [Solenopsis invicta]